MTGCEDFYSIVISNAQRGQRAAIQAGLNLSEDSIEFLKSQLDAGQHTPEVPFNTLYCRFPQSAEVRCSFGNKPPFHTLVATERRNSSLDLLAAQEVVELSQLPLGAHEVRIMITLYE